MELPRLLLVTQAPLDAQNGGINRTLSNLLDFYLPDYFMLCSDRSLIKQYPTDPPFNKNVIGFYSQYFPYMNNRIGNVLNPIIQSINLQLIDLLPFPNLKQIQAFDPQILLICPNSSADLITGYKISKVLGCPFVIYFMDDWLHDISLSWLTGNIQIYARELLNRASGWLMISHELEEVFIKRYNLAPKQSMIIQNPVEVNGKKLRPPKNSTDETFRIVYSGAIWPMHYDTVLLVAEAVSQLRAEGKRIELILHTAPIFWKLYKEKWEKWEVINGSLIPYAELNQYLQRADLLLVPSSFLAEMEPIIRTTVQTKITDYMAAGRAILACGPSYSASNLFIKRWNCGLVCEFNEVIYVSKFLIHKMDNRSQLTTLGNQAYRVAHEYFDKSIVNKKLKDLICSIIST